MSIVHRIGVKSSWKPIQLAQRFILNPPLIEIHLNDGELESESDAIALALKSIRNKGIDITIHQPHRYNGLPVGLAYSSSNIIANTLECWTRIQNLCRDIQASGFVVHPFMFLPHNEHIDCHRTLLQNLYYAESFFSDMFLENDGEDNFSQPRDITWILDRTSIDLRLCLDIAHLYMALHDNNAIFESLQLMRNRVSYLHISDSDGYTDALPLSEGEVDFSTLEVLPPCSGVLEVRNDNEEHPVAMVSSWVLWKEYEAKNV